MRRLIALFVLLLLARCAVGPDYQAPEPPLAGQWASLSDQTGGASSVATATTADVAEWWRAFGDPTLTSLAVRALAQNLDLRTAEARVREARALVGVARGELLPEVSAEASYSRLRPSENGFIPSSGGSINLYQAGFDASWEIDVFGGGRRGIEAAAAGYEASIEAMRDVRVTLLAELARSYVELRGFQARIAITHQNLEAQQKTAELIRAQLDAGQIAELNLARAEAQVSAIEATIPALEAAARQRIHGIAVLLAQTPGTLVEQLSASEPIPSAPREIPIGLPTDLLRRRPDIRRAERELAVATALTGVATADLYPRFFLTGGVGVESVDASNLFSAPSLVWSIIPSIRWSVFQGGKISANIEVHDARQEQAVRRFEIALLDALRNVEDTLVAHSTEQLRRATLARAVTSQRRALALATERYELGLEDFLSVLDAQRVLYDSQDSLVQSDQAVAANSIALYKALGGGWEPPAKQHSD